MFYHRRVRPTRLCRVNAFLRFHRVSKAFTRDVLDYEREHEHEHDYSLGILGFVLQLLTSHSLSLLSPRPRFFQLQQARHEFVVRVTKRFEEQQIKERD
jgi:hypothetical protein